MPPLLLCVLCTLCLLFFVVKSIQDVRNRGKAIKIQAHHRRSGPVHTLPCDVWKNRCSE